VVSGATAAMLSVHRALDTWEREVDAYIALSEFARRKFVEGGLTAEKIAVKPNFIDPDPGMGEGRGDYVLFVGRLSQEKGVDTMLAGWERLADKVPLKVVGDGPLASKVAEAAKRFEEIEWLGRQPKDRVLALMKEAQALVLPSVCYENFPIVLAEAYAVGLPVIASNLGGMSSLVHHGSTGLHFQPGDPESLALQVEWASAHPVRLRQMREKARAEFEAKYTAEQNHQSLMEIYQTAAGRMRARV
jgi:glycosyltransferase involved in cell wall biosynthesis